MNNYTASTTRSALPLFGGPSSKVFLYANAAQNLLNTGLHVAKGAQQLYLYHNGRYVPGEELLRGHLANDLASDWSPARADAIGRWLYDSAPDLWERPPLDRVNVANGILDLASAALVPHTPEFLSPVQCPIAHDPEARPTLMTRFLHQVLPGDGARLVLKLSGWLLVPDTSMQVAALFVGDGANGKSVLLAAMEALVGPENVSHHSLHVLSHNRFATADLYGKLANIAADIPGVALEDTSVFKAMTGGDRLQAERKFRPSFSFTPFARLIFSGQEVPPAPDRSYGYQRR